MIEPDPRLIRTGTEYERVADEIRRDLVSGVHGPGKRLKIGELVDLYKCGPGAVREVLQQLSGEGWVDIQPNRGASVRPITAETIIDMYEVREYLEVLTAKRFVDNASNIDIQKLEDIQHQFDQAASIQEHENCSVLNGLFHDHVIVVAGNMEALTIIRRIGRVMYSIRRSVGFGHKRLDTVSAEHHEMLDAFRDRNAKAAERITHVHLTGAADDLIERYQRASLGRSENTTDDHPYGLP